MSAQPTVNTARQAVASLGGYAYQIYASAIAWVTLKSNETLLLEVAEDYAISTATALSAVQVKNTNQSVTLNTSGIVQAIDSFVELAINNAESDVKLHYLTTSEIGLEQKVEDRVKGLGCLAYWQSVRFQGNIEPLRERLLGSKISKRSKAYIRTLVGEDFRLRFIQKISWDCGAPKDAELKSQLRDALVYLGESLGFLPTESENVSDKIISSILALATSQGQRALIRADLLRLFENSTTQSLSNLTLRTLIGASAANVGAGPGSHTGILSVRTTIEPVDSSPFPSIYATREILLAEISRRHAEQGVAWLYAGTGFGKTLLAISNAIQSKRDAGMVRLRGLTAEQVEIVLEKTRGALLFSGIGELILDDLNDFRSPSVQMALGRLLKTARTSGKLVTVCAYERPSDRVFDTISINQSAALAISKFDDADFRILVHTAPDNHEAWIKYVRASCGGGHPQLTHAMVLGLIRRKWPISEIANLSGLLGRDHDLMLTKEEARKRLVDELPEHSRRLLYRLTLLISSFERDLAKIICEVKPVIPSSGEAFDDLVGPWVDRVSREEFQVSPLVNRAGAEQLSASEQQAVHKIIANALTKAGRIDGRYFDQVLISGLAGKANNALFKLAVATLGSEVETLRLLASHSIGLVLMRTDRKIYPSSERNSVQLRAAQILLILASTNTDQFRPALEAFEREVSALRDDYGEALLRMSLYGKLLLNPDLAAIYPEFPLMIASLSRLLAKQGLEKEFDFPENAGYLGVTLSSGQALFMQQMTQIPTLNVLLDILQVLRGLDEVERNGIVPAVDSIRYNPLQVIKMIWVREKERAGYASEEFATNCLQFAHKFMLLSETDYAAGCYVVASIIHCEELSDHPVAIALLDEATIKFGSLIELKRQRASIHFIAKNYQGVIDAIEPYLGDLIDEGWIEKTYLYRELAIAHGNLCNWPQAIKRFSEAREFSSKVESESFATMPIGLQADMAVAMWKANDCVQALREMGSALSKLVQIDPTLNLKASALHRLVRFSGWWLYTEHKSLLKKFPDIDATMVIGCNSNPNPHPELRGPPGGTVEMIFYLLAEVDLALGARSGVWTDIVSNFPPDRAHLGQECTLRLSVIMHAIESRNPELFAMFAAEKIDATAIMSPDFLKDFDMQNPVRGKLPLASPAVFAANREKAVSECGLLILGCILFSESEKIAELFELQVIAERPVILAQEIISYKNRATSAQDPSLSMYGALGELAQSIENGTRPGADNLLIGCLRMLELMRGVPGFTELKTKFSVWAFEQWAASIREERFRYKTPNLAESEIYKALYEQSRSLAGVANVLIAAAPYLDPNIGQGIIQNLRTYQDF